MEKKKQIKVGIIVVGLAAAVTITLISNLSDSAADAEDSSTLWKCAACLKTFDLTAREAARAQRAAGGVPILCPRCDKVRGYQVMACPKDGTLFFGSEVPNHNGQCPVCFLAVQKAKKQQAPKEEDIETEPHEEQPKVEANKPQPKPTTQKADRKEKEKDSKKKKEKKKTPKKKKKKPAPKSL